MICSKNCTCLLCRELQSCQPKGSKSSKKSSSHSNSNNNSSDNFILRKAEAFKSGGGALGFIRGAARMSVRNWQNRGDSKSNNNNKNHSTQPPRVSRAASCEQIFPPKRSDSKMHRAPSCEQLSKKCPNEKPFLRLIAESKFVGKSHNSDMYSGGKESAAKGVLKFRRSNNNNDTYTKHEKYVPLPIYEPKYGKSNREAFDSERASPLYQEIKKKTESKKGSSSVRVGQSKKQTTDLAACFQELSKNRRSENDSHPMQSAPPPPPPPLPPPIQGENKKGGHKVVIYFGDSMARNSGNQFGKDEDAYYARSLLNVDSAVAAKTQKTSATAELVSQISIAAAAEPIYTEITDLDAVDDNKQQQQDDVAGDLIATEIEDGVINVEFKENFECARRWVDIISGSAVRMDDGPDPANETLDWSFVQGWRKRPPNGSRATAAGDASYNGVGHHDQQQQPQHQQQQPSPHHQGLPIKHQQSVGSSHHQSGGNHNNSSLSSPSSCLQPPAPLVRVHTPASLAQHHRLSSGKDIAADESASLASTKLASNSMIPERDTGPSSSSSYRLALKSGVPSTPSKITVQSTPVKSQNPMISYGLDRVTTAPLGRKDGGGGGVVPKDWRQVSGGGGNHAECDHHQLVAGQHQTQLQHHQQQQQQQQQQHLQPHHHVNLSDVRNGVSQRSARECNSSSDENRSSGHASMSDSGGGGTGGALVGGSGPHDDKSGGGGAGGDRLSAGVTQRSTRSRASSHHSRNRHRATPAKLQVPWSGAGGLEDIRLAIQQLTLRSHTSTSTYSSLSAGSDHLADAAARVVRAPRLVSHSSLETVNTNVTSADEFVWVDSHNRLVELQQLPWSASDLQRVLHAGRCRDLIARISAETIPRVGYLLQRALVRIAREAHRLSQGFGLCSKHEVAGALRIVLCPSLADSCVKSCLRAATMFAVSGDSGLRQSKAQRAALQLSVGRFHRWMVDVRLGRFIHEYAAIYLCAGMETLLEEIILICMPTEPGACLTPTLLEHAIASSGDLWGLLQPYAHLNAGRVASGALSMPRWASLSSIGSGGSSNSANTSTNDTSHNNSGPIPMSGHQSANSPAGNPSIGKNSNGSGSSSTSSTESWLLTTCVGSVGELRELLARASPPPPAHATPLTAGAVGALFYFMRCSQLEHSQRGGGSGVQELWYERAYAVLPPLVEWTRVAGAHAEQRGAAAADRDDVMQAARLLLPGVDCPPRPVGMEECLPPKRLTGVSSCEDGGRAQLELSFRLLLSGRADLVAQAINLLPAATGLNTLNHHGLTALMLAATRNDEQVTTMLLDAGADPNVETPGCSGGGSVAAVSPPPPPAASPWGAAVAGWTALVYACARGAVGVAAALLARGARVEGAATHHEDRTTLTPLQVACGAGCVELVQLLLTHGAHPFLSTLLKDSLCYSGSAQRGCYSAISVCCVHGQRAALRCLLSHPIAPQGDVLSLEEMLAEGAPNSPAPSLTTASSAANPANKFTKSQLRALQEAMYHSAETNHLDITLELRALGVSWSLHSWMLSLAAAADRRMDSVIDQLLQDFLQVCPDEYSRTFAHECLPLLFNIFRYSKKEGTTLLLADIFCTCYGWEAIKPIREPAPVPNTASRIDPKFVNNPELSDVTFRVEGRLFYGHKIVLVTASPRLRAMLAPPRSTSGHNQSSSTSLGAQAPNSSGAGSNSSISGSQSGQSTQAPTVQINDIRYHIFQLVMQFLYSGGCNGLDVPSSDVLELLAAASFFQLLPLQRYCEARCAQALDLHNVVNMYIHAKVYNAVQLLEYCQGFLLQNMVALLTYDDSVKRLLFGKRLPGHDVLGALLTTLQQRIKARRGPNKSR